MTTDDYRTTDLRRKDPASAAVSADEILQAKSNVDFLGRRWFAVPQTALELEVKADDRAELMHHYHSAYSTPATAVFAIHESTFAKLAGDVQDWLDAFGTARDDVKNFSLDDRHAAAQSARAMEMNTTRPTYATQQADEATHVRITALETQLDEMHLAVRQLVGLWLSLSVSEDEESEIRAWLSDNGLGDPVMPSEQRVTFTAQMTFTFDEEVFDVADVRRRKLCETLLERALTDIDGSVADIITVESSVDSESITVEPIP